MMSSSKNELTPGADLRRAQLAGADLHGRDLSSADLREADLRDADLTGVDLRRARLERADLRGAKLARANIQYAELAGARFDPQQIVDAYKEDNPDGIHCPICGAWWRGAFGIPHMPEELQAGKPRPCGHLSREALVISNIHNSGWFDDGWSEARLPALDWFTELAREVTDLEFAVQAIEFNRGREAGWPGPGATPPKRPDLGLSAIQNIDFGLWEAIGRHFVCIEITQGGPGTANAKTYPFAVDPQSALVEALHGFTRLLRDLENPFPLRLPTEALNLCEVDEMAETEFEGHRTALLGEIQSLIESL